MVSHCGEEGLVPREIVKDVLKACDINVTQAEDGVGFVIIRSTIVGVYKLPEQVPRKLISHLANKYGVNIEYFYHPEMINNTIH